MSFVSSLNLFYPGKNPVCTIEKCRFFCEDMRSVLHLNDDELDAEISLLTDNQLPTIRWDDHGLIGFIDNAASDRRTWDYIQRCSAWNQLLPVFAWDKKIIDRAKICLGYLPQAFADELTATDGDDSYIVPSHVIFSIAPTAPNKIDNNLPNGEYVGSMELSISGMGYFSWQSTNSYWQTVCSSTILVNALKLCREYFPVSIAIDPINLKDYLGDLFLNYNEYQVGDWVVSISESS